MNSEDLEDDTEEELSLLYEDDENDIKEEEIKPNIGELNGKKQLSCENCKNKPWQNLETWYERIVPWILLIVSIV